LGIEEQRVNVIIDFTDPDKAFQRLGHGYRVDVSIRIWKADDVLRIPVGALFRERNQWATYVVDATSTARLRHIQIDHMGERFAEVRDGLEAGDDVVVHPSDRVADGIPVVRRRKRP
jgi:HlyD family secretion protein